MMPTLHLVVDEVVPVHAHRFRVRVWRGRNPRALVLSSQVQGDVPPDWYSSAIANLVLRSFLGFTNVIPIFLEFSRWDGKVRAFRVTFETIGCHLRPILVNPAYLPLDTQVIDQLFKVSPDTPNQGAA
jgi:hypothetical protein